MLNATERVKIIVDAEKGIQHPDYEVYKTKTGKTWVRRRKQTAPGPQVTVVPTAVEKSEPKVETTGDDEFRYESISNKQLMEKMLNILEQNVVSRDQNKNSVENERETADNRRFIEEIKEQHQPVSAPQAKRRPRGRVLQ